MAAAHNGGCRKSKKDDINMNKKPYAFLEIHVCLWEKEDVITLSNDDELGDDIFG